MTEQDIVSLIEILENVTKWLEKYGILAMLGFALAVILVGTVIKSRRKIRAVKDSEGNIETIHEERDERKKENN